MLHRSSTYVQHLVGICGGGSRLARVGSSRDNPGNLFYFMAGLRRDVLSFKESVGDKLVALI